MNHPSLSSNHRRPRLLDIWAAAAIMVLLSSLTLTIAADWPNWRGPAGNGSATSGAFPARWNAASVTWKVPLPGKGGSTPVVWRDRIHLTTPADGQDAVLALDFSGKQIWQTKLGAESPPKHRTLGSSCNASPVTDGKALFVSYASPVIANGLLYASREDGVVFTAKVGEKLELQSENSMGERIVASPALANGRLLVRGDKHLFCVGPTEVVQN